MSEFDLDFDPDKDLDGFDLVAAGTYHLAVADVDLTREKRDGCVMKIEIMAGTVATEVGKTFQDSNTDPSSSHKDGGKFALKRIAKMLLAAGVLTRADFGKGKKLDIERQGELKTKQFIAAVSHRKHDGKVYAQIDGLQMWSVHDPEVANVPKNAEMLKFAPLPQQTQPQAAATPAAAQSAPAATEQAPAPAAVNTPANDAFAELGL